MTTKTAGTETKATSGARALTFAEAQAFADAATNDGPVALAATPPRKRQITGRSALRVGAVDGKEF